MCKPSQKWNYVVSDNLGKNIEEKITKLSKIHFPMEFVTTGFLQYTVWKVSF